MITALEVDVYELLVFLGDHRFVVLALALIGFVPSAGYVAWRVLTSPPKGATLAQPQTPARPPIARPASAPSVAAGQIEHQQRSQAKTVKVATPAERRPITTQLLRPAPPPPPVSPSAETLPAPITPAKVDQEDAARDDLFAGLGAPEPGPDTVRRAERLGELDFHHTAKPNEVVAEPPTVQKTETPPVQKAESAPVQKVATPAPQTPPSVAPAGPRTQTQELDDILSRIDKVLADKPVAQDAQTQQEEPPAKPEGQQRIF